MKCANGCGRDAPIMEPRVCCMACGDPERPFADPRSTTGHTALCEHRNRWPDVPMPADTPAVPPEFVEWQYEYVDGYRSALKGPGCYSPIAHRAVHGRERRKAWEAGRKAGNAERKRRESV